MLGGGVSQGSSFAEPHRVAQGSSLAEPHRVAQLQLAEPHRVGNARAARLAAPPEPAASSPPAGAGRSRAHRRSAGLCAGPGRHARRRRRPGRRRPGGGAGARARSGRTPLRALRPQLRAAPAPGPRLRRAEGDPRDPRREAEPLTLTEISQRLGRTPGSTKDYLSWLDDVDLVSVNRKRYRFRDPLLRVWCRLHCRPDPPAEEIAREVEAYADACGRKLSTANERPRRDRRCAAPEPLARSSSAATLHAPSRSSACARRFLLRRLLAGAARRPHHLAVPPAPRRGRPSDGRGRSPRRPCTPAAAARATAPPPAAPTCSRGPRTPGCARPRAGSPNSRRMKSRAASMPPSR